MNDRRASAHNARIINSGFSAKLKFIAFNKSHCQTESVVPFKSATTYTR